MSAPREQPGHPARRGQGGERADHADGELGGARSEQLDDAAGQEPGDDEEQDRDHSTPFVDGSCPALRGSISTASRSARENALNCASTTWWASGTEPSRAARSTLTCRVSRAAKPNDSKMCRVMLVG